ncbi:XkdX family protein [Paenibacillus aquistagni]|uniref:Phage uncharacterized protein, XkdX family n=1 Tax=Paenibacillus aquistagni TaxID=1852522 RepID=A0A1X7LY48_9BACL|nr:XkdX family protein [Paenibacillus aquistagni]SMG58182.1 phage uncharacterized protein, XkdX family [Paenibacillus aquistagni]
MNWYAIVKRYYDMGIYKIDPADPMYVGQFVQLGKITEEQYKEITNIDFEA